MKRMAVLLACAYCLAAPAGPAWSAEKSLYELSLEELSRMVITPTKIPESYETVTQKVWVIPAAKFELQTEYNRNISELLESIPGQFVDVLSRNDANFGSYGGLGSKYNGFFLDGLPIDSFADAMSLDPWAFDRIELHEGPSAVVYPNYLTMDFVGNESPLGGITNIVLKDRIDAPATRIKVGYGWYNTFNARFYHQDHKGDFHYFMGANYEHSDYTNYGAAVSFLNMTRNPEYEKTKIYAKATYLLGRDDHALSLFAHHTMHTGFVGRPNRDFNFAYDTVDAAYANQLTDALNLQLKTGYRGYYRVFGQDNFPVLSPREHDGVVQRIFPSDLTLNLHHAGDGLLTFGADSQVATYKTYTEAAATGFRATGNDVSAAATGLFLQEKLVLDRWVARAGARFNYTHHSYDLFNGVRPDRTSNSWSNLLWSAGVRRNVSPRWSFYGNVGSGAVAPSAKDLGGTLRASDAGAAGKDGQLPNPGLRMERGLSSDLGADYKPLESLNLGLRGFFSRVTDAIIDNVVSAIPSQSQAVNAGKIISRGVELSADQAVADDFKWFANATYTATRVENPLNADEDGGAIPFVPDYVANVGITAKVGSRLTISPYMRMIGRYYDSDSLSGRTRLGLYQVANVKISAKLHQDSDHVLSAGLDLNNIFDRRYDMPFQFRDPGFNASASLELDF